MIKLDFLSEFFGKLFWPILMQLGHNQSSVLFCITDCVARFIINDSTLDWIGKNSFQCIFFLRVEKTEYSSSSSLISLFFHSLYILFVCRVSCALSLYVVACGMCCYYVPGFSIYTFFLYFLSFLVSLFLCFFRGFFLSFCYNNICRIELLVEFCHAIIRETPERIEIEREG